MKGLILSGGRGTRLRPLTFSRAKQLLPIANRPVLLYGLEALVAAGVTEIGVIVGETRDEVEAALGDGSRWGARITYIPQEAPLGLAHAVQTARDFLAPTPFVMYLGDNLIREGVRGVVEDFAARRPNAEILLAAVPNPSQFGVVEVEGDRVVRLEEKPPRPRSDLALVGVYLFDQTVFEAIERITPSARGELEITDAIQNLVDTGHAVHARRVQGWWKDTGKPEDLLEANRIVLDDLETDIRGTVDGASAVEGRVVIEAGATVTESRIRGPVVIGRDCRIATSYVGPYTAVGDGAVLEGSEVEHSILMAGARLTDLPQRLADSLVGVEAVVESRPDRGAGRGAAVRLVIGDASRVSL